MRKCPERGEGVTLGTSYPILELKRQGPKIGWETWLARELSFECYLYLFREWKFWNAN